MTYVVNDKCVMCKHTTCVSVCPVDCCVPDEDRPEEEVDLLAKKDSLHH